jgi:iron complex outermembrane receptor protein
MRYFEKLRNVVITGAFAISSVGVIAENNNLETIVVVGELIEAIETDLVGSIDVLSQEELSYEHVDDTLELFNKVPGVYLARYNQGIINTDVAIRGFAGDGVTPHAKLLIDGIPSNLHNGYNELDQLSPLNISSISVFKGTSDPRYGVFNIAGNYNVETRQDEAKEIELTLGSFNTAELQTYAGLNNGNLLQSYSIAYRTTEGYRDHTDLDKLNLSGSWQWELDSSKSIRVIARHATYEGDSPGYINDPVRAEANPELSEDFARNDGGEKETSHLSVHWTQEFNENLDWTLKAYAQNFERDRWVRFTDIWDLSNRFDDQDIWGVTSTLKFVLSDTLSLDWGIDYEFQDVLEQRFASIGNERIKGASFRNRAYDFISYGTYWQLFHEPTDQLRWNIALRADQLDGDFVNQDSGETRDMHDFGTIVQPKLNIVYATSDQLNLFLNAGRSFQHPTGISAYQATGAEDRDVSINDGWEIGAQFTPSDSLTFRISYWQQDASDEFINVDGTNQNVGETERKGIDLSFNGDLSDTVSFWGSYTTIDTEIVRAADGASVIQGNELRSIPDFTASLGLNFQVTSALVARLHLDAQGDYFINEANFGGKFGDFTLLSASADYETNWGKIKFQLNNITDEYYEYAFDFRSFDANGIPVPNSSNFTIHSPGDGINGSVSFSINL